METRRKIEEAINSFREKRKQSIAFDLEAQEKEKVLNLHEYRMSLC